MFNLLIRYELDSWDKLEYSVDIKRFGEFTDKKIFNELSDLNSESIEKIKTFPCLFMYEGNRGHAKIGTITNIRKRSNSIFIEFEFDSNFPPLPSEMFSGLLEKLDINEWELNRTHWAFKDEDLLKVLTTSDIFVKTMKSFKQINKVESSNVVYQEVKKRGILKGQKLDFLNFICLYGPCSANELIAEVQKNKLVENSYEVSKLNRHPSVLKDMKLIRVNSFRKCKVSSSKKEVEILEVVDEIPTISKRINGKSLKVLESSRNAALLAVEVYNKPRTAFRTESYISLMINAWTKLMHAYFRLHLGEVYFYPKKNGENFKRSWDITKCIKEFNKLSAPTQANLKLFIDLRNEVEHGLVDDKIIDTNFFGECQALLYNYENFLITHFGENYSINESLAFSLQFSIMRDASQNLANRKMMSSEAREIISYLDKYRSSLDDNIYDSQEFSIKLLQVPRISNTNKSDLAIKFVKYDELNSDDMKNYNIVTGLIKKQVERVSIANEGKFRPSQALKQINKGFAEPLSLHDLNCLYKIFKLKPAGEEKKKFPEKTISKFCIYDQPNESYLYTSDWVAFVISLITKYKFDKLKIRDLDKRKEFLDYTKFP